MKTILDGLHRLLLHPNFTGLTLNVGSTEILGQIV